MPVIPVLLPDAPQHLELPLFLNAIMYVDLRKENQNEGVRRLICGIRGEKPGPGITEATVETQGSGSTVGIDARRGHSNRSRLLGPIPELFGRDKELAKLNDLLDDSKTHIVAIVGPGGIGKSALVRVWRENLDLSDTENEIAYFDWCFRDQVNRGYEADAATAFVNEALAWFGDDRQRVELPGESGARLAKRVVEAGKRTILILDNIESLQWSAGPRQGEFRDNDLEFFLIGLKDRRFAGLCVITTQQPLTNLKNRGHVKEIKLEKLSPPAGTKLLFEAGAQKWGDIPLTPNAEELLHSEQGIAWASAEP